jgi:hypothetical protein
MSPAFCFSYLSDRVGFFFFFKLGLAWILILLLMPLHGWMAEVCHRAQLSSVEMVFSLTFCLGYPQTTILMSAS